MSSCPPPLTTLSLRPMRPDTTLCCARSCSSTSSPSFGPFWESSISASAKCFTSRSCQRPKQPSDPPASSGRPTQSWGRRPGRKSSDDGPYICLNTNTPSDQASPQNSTSWFTPNGWLWQADYGPASCYHPPAPSTPATTEMSCTRCSHASSG